MMPGVTHSLKNQIEIVPLQYYVMPGMSGYRSRLHIEGSHIGNHLPRSICELNFARPVHLAVIDGIKNTVGEEGVWNSTFKTAEDQVLLAETDPVATDSIASFLLGNDPEAGQLELPDSVRQCDNYLELLHQKGMGTNRLSEIEVVGDRAHLVPSIQSGYKVIPPGDFCLFQNFPNPFNPSTTMPFYLPHTEYVTIKLYNIVGTEIEILVESKVHYRINFLYQFNK